MRTIFRELRPKNVLVLPSYRERLFIGGFCLTDFGSISNGKPNNKIKN